MKHLFKNAFLILGLMLMTFSSCQKDNFEDEQLEVLQEENTKNNLFKKGKLSDYSQVKEFVKTLKNNKHDGNIAFRTSMETSNAFVILENQDIAIHSGDEFNTYTIPIVKLQQPEHTFSNLVVQFSVVSDSTNAYILTYNPNPGYLEDYAMDDRTAFSGEVTYEPLEYDGSLDNLNLARLICQNISITYCNNTLDGNGTGPVHSAGSSCNDSDKMWTEHYSACYDDGSSGFTETIEPPSGPRGGGTSGSGTTNSPNTGSSTSTLPANVVNEIVSILNLNELNDQAEIIWLNDYANFSEVISLFLYLDVYKNSIGVYEQAALDFVEFALEALIADAEVVFEEHIIFEPSWDDLDCQKAIIKSSTNGFGDISNSIQTLFGNNPYISLTYKTGDITSPPGTLVGAHTTSNYNSEHNLENINITFNNIFLNQATDLMIFSIGIHENLHAILTILLENEMIDGVNENVHLSFLVQEYAEYKANKIVNDNPNYNQEDLEYFAHEAISDLVEDIAQEIKAYGLSKGYDANDFHYEALAWSGLTGTLAFATMNTEFQDAINEIIEYETTNFEPLAEGEPCN